MNLDLQVAIAVLVHYSEVLCKGDGTSPLQGYLLKVGSMS